MQKKNTILTPCLGTLLNVPTITIYDAIPLWATHRDHSPVVPGERVSRHKPIFEETNMEPKNWTLHGPEQVIQFGSNVVPALSSSWSFQAPTIVLVQHPTKGYQDSPVRYVRHEKPTFLAAGSTASSGVSISFKCPSLNGFSDSQYLLHILDSILILTNVPAVSHRKSAIHDSEIDKPNPVTSVAAWTSSVTRGLGVGHDRMMQWCIST